MKYHAAQYASEAEASAPLAEARGSLGAMGLFGGDYVLPLPIVTVAGSENRGDYAGSLTESKEMVALAHSGTLPPLPIVCMHKAQVNDVFSDLRAGQVRGHVVLTP